MLMRSLHRKLPVNQKLDTLHRESSMKLPVQVTVLSVALSLGACSSVERMTGSEPIIDTKGIDMVMYETDLAECEAYADEVQVGRKAATGAVAGAVVGGVVGAIFGNSSTAQRGAGAGAATGTLSGTGRGLEDRRRVIRNCLAGRGYRVLN